MASTPSEIWPLWLLLIMEKISKNNISLQNLTIGKRLKIKQMPYLYIIVKSQFVIPKRLLKNTNSVIMWWYWLVSRRCFFLFTSCLLFFFPCFVLTMQTHELIAFSPIFHINCCYILVLWSSLRSFFVVYSSFYFFS